MTESAFSTARGAEISERSTELVLPGTTAPDEQAPANERNFGVKESDSHFRREFDSREIARGEFEPAESGKPIPTTQGGRAANSALPTDQVGRPLPGDRGRQTQQAPKERPSFWRRIALGRRVTKTRDPQQAGDEAMLTAPAKLLNKGKDPLPRANDSIERRIIEPMLQALVSVEAKLERSHIELVGRSDQVEQRLTQLWDIEEQLGTLGEIQESLLQISDQQRRLESAFVGQNRTLRWLIGAVLFAIAAAAFIVAAVLR